MDDATGKQVRSEFTRQAQQMDAAPAFRAGAVLERFVQAVGDSPSDQLLDVACGPGIVAEALAAHMGQVTGIDATPAMIRLARRRFDKAGLLNGRFQVASAEQLPFEPGSFDQVVTRLSFHHFLDVPQVLGENRRVLRPGGRLVAADIISADDAEQSGLHNSIEKLRDPTHVGFFARAAMVRMIEAAGFSITQQVSWEQRRSFDEWAAIIADPARMQPLEHVMRALARAGQGCGVSLHEEGSRLVFTHTWLLVVAARD